MHCKLHFTARYIPKPTMMMTTTTIVINAVISRIRHLVLDVCSFSVPHSNKELNPPCVLAMWA